MKSLSLNYSQTPAGKCFIPNFVGAGTLGQRALISNAVKFSAAALSPSMLQSSHFTSVPPPFAVQQMSGLARGCTLYNNEQEALEEPGGTEGGQARWAMMWKKYWASNKKLSWWNKKRKNMTVKRRSRKGEINKETSRAWTTPVSVAGLSDYSIYWKRQQVWIPGEKLLNINQTGDTSKTVSQLQHHSIFMFY